MDSLKLIPSVFFDCIARVVLGATGIVAFLVLSDSSWSQVLGRVLGPAFAEKDALLLSTVLYFSASYLVGQVIAPLAKAMQRLGERKIFKPGPKAHPDAYDFLRIGYMDAGAQCAKTRLSAWREHGNALSLQCRA